MSDGAENLKVSHLGGSVIAAPAGAEVQTLYASPLIAELGRALYELVARHPGQRIVLDLTAIHYASTEFLGKLISLNSRVRQAKGGLTLCGLSPSLREALQILKVLPLFDVSESVDAALGLTGFDATRTTADFPEMP